MADYEKRADNCGTALFAYDFRRRAFALVSCARFPNALDSVPQGIVILGRNRNEQRNEESLSAEVAGKLSETCKACLDHQEGSSRVDQYKGIGEGTDSEYYGGEHPEWEGVIPTAEVQEAMQEMGA